MTADIRRIWDLFADGRRLFVVAVLIAAIEALLFLPIGLVVARVFDRYIPDRDERAIVIASGAMLVLYLAGAGTSLAARRIAVGQSREAVAGLRGRVIAHAYRMPRSWHDGEDTGALRSQIVNDTDRVEFMLDRLANPALPAAIVIVALAIAALVITPLAFAALIVTVPVMVVVAQVFGRPSACSGSDGGSRSAAFPAASTGGFVT